MPNISSSANGVKTKNKKQQQLLQLLLQQQLLLLLLQLLGSRLIFRREGKWPFDEFHAMLKSLKFHWDFCFLCGDSWQKTLFFSSAKCG